MEALRQVEADQDRRRLTGLHLEPGAADHTITLSTIKGNLGYQFKKITLQRDPHTVCASAIALERYGDPSKQPTSAEDVINALTKLVRMEIIPLPSTERTKWAVVETLYRKAKEAGLKISRETIRGFAGSHLRYEERTLGNGKKALVVTGTAVEEVDI